MEKNCEHCGNLFEARRLINRFCSTSCSAKWRTSNLPLPKSCFKKGDKSWNTGEKISGMSGKSHRPDTLKKMSESHIALHDDPKTKLEYRLRRRGEYQRWRHAVFNRDGHKCVFCQSSKDLQADHILPFEAHEEKRLDVENGRTLCKPCHIKTESHGASRSKQLTTKNRPNHCQKGEIHDKKC
jgi:5-methylcytosine-specific restriction endonuclease McrA